ncbi:hypothetical protein [Burkholderia cenocepacia]|uniref:hypothetical protein n=1 Tax=Burkholderia cenocepacia TaxID=95486 RepID=UPI0019031296|nr:hypothetical protein [Burkholderia cenocepacia]MBJ9694130.1 hypothetical protein [Burkholderia cenocepacia]
MEKTTTRPRCRVGDLAKVVASKNPALIGTIVTIQRMRSDGRWDVLLEAPAFGFTGRMKKPIVTREFSFWDESLEPLPQYAGELVAERPVFVLCG